MEPKRTLHSGNLVRSICAGDRKLFMEKYYDPEKYMELGTCFVREEEERFIKKLVDAEVASKPILARGELLDFKDRGQRRKL